MNTAVVCVDCPTMVNITPAAGSSFKEGDELTCMSDGRPVPSYTWSHVNGTLVSHGSTTTLPAGFFHLTCTATGNFTTPCSTNRTVDGFGKILVWITSVLLLIVEPAVECGIAVTDKFFLTKKDDGFYISTPIRRGNCLSNLFVACLQQLNIKMPVASMHSDL